MSRAVVIGDKVLNQPLPKGQCPGESEAFGVNMVMRRAVRIRQPWRERCSACVQKISLDFAEGARKPPRQILSQRGFPYGIGARYSYKH